MVPKVAYLGSIATMKIFKSRTKNAFFDYFCAGI